MEEPSLLYRGTSFEFCLQNKESQKYMLVELYEDDFVFQIVCLTGYYAGVVEGLVINELLSAKAITIEHLKKELNRNFKDIDWNTFQLFPA